MRTEKIDGDKLESSELWELFKNSDRIRFEKYIAFHINQDANQYLELSINWSAFRHGEITIDDIENIFNVYLSETFNDDLGAYSLEVDHRNERVTVKITDYLS